MPESCQAMTQPAQSGPKDRGTRWGVILLCHGSQRGTSREECSCSWGAQDGDWPAWCCNCPSTPLGLANAAQRLQAELGPGQARVLLSCLEFLQPHPDQAVQMLAEEGLERVVIMPYLLGQGKHATLELEEVVDEIRAKSPRVQISLADGLGSDPRLADLVVDRVRALGTAGPVAPHEAGPVGILLVKAGTKTQYDDCRWLEDLGHMVEKRLGLGYAVAVAQSHYGDPTMEAAAAKLVDDRGASAIVCVPYLFFPGMILRRNVLGGLDRLQQRYPDLPMLIAPPLGVDDRLVAVAADRVWEVWGLKIETVNG